jgi:hypothetical protein
MAPALAAAALGVIALATPGASASRVLPVVLPAFAVLAGVQVEVGAAALRRRSSPLVAACLTAGALAALLVPSLIRDWKLSRLLLRPDTRSVARQWIDARLPPGEAVATLGGGACSRPRFAGTRAEIHLAAPPGAGEAAARWVVVDSTPFSALSPELSAAEIAALDARGTLALDLDPREAGTPVPLYDPVDPLFVPLQHASSVKRPGPRIRIWQLRSD